jgi:glycolate oxidase
MTATASAPRSAIAADFLAALRQIVGHDGLLADRDELLVYECDGFTIEKSVPDVVVFPASTEQVVAIVRLCNQYNVPFVPRGAGTSLSGGCLPVGGGVMIALTRMRRIIEVNLRDRYAVVEPGLVNVHLTQHLKGSGYHYAPDPSSQGACTIGGNFATNSGGPHTLKYGVTVNHILGAEMVMPDGSVVELGGPVEDVPGYDLTGLFVGNEGTFGICTKIIVRLTRDPGLPHDAGRLQFGFGCHADDQQDHRRRDRAGGPGAHGPRDHRGGRGRVPFWLSAGRGGRTAHRS